ncbi:DUF1589 domain-containing protein [Rhodopirellula europaea]
MKHLNPAESSYGLAGHVGQVITWHPANALAQSEAV